MPRVSLCMIVCNEEENIKQCLTSAEPYVDEIIVIDTGSQDQTPNIVEQFGAQLYRMKWNDHFAEARNYATKRATGDWILVLDADEQLLPIDFDLFKSLLADETVSGYYVLIRNHRSDVSDDYETDFVCRLFRNLPNISYQGRVHEDIGVSLSTAYPKLAIRRSGLIVSHYGYSRMAEHANKKTERNVKLLERAVREESDPFFYRYAIGVESFLQEHYQRAAEDLAPLLPKVPPTTGYAADLAYKLAYSYWRSGRNTEALQAVKTGLVREPLYADLQELHAVLLLEEGRPEEALHRLTQYAKTATFTEEKQAERANYWLGLAHQQLGNWQQALLYLEKCLHTTAYREQAKPRWLDLALLIYPLTEVESRLTAALHSLEELAIPIYLGSYVTKWGYSSRMLPLLEGLKLDGTSEDLQLQELAFFYAIMLAQTGETEKSSEILHQLIHKKPEKHLLIYLWALQNAGGESLVQLNLLYAFRDTEPELASLADRLLHGNPSLSPAPSVQLLEQAAYAMLMMRAWSGFQLVWQHLHGITTEGRQSELPKAWRPAIYQSPAHIREIILQGHSPETSRYGERLFGAQLAYSLGKKEESIRLFTQLKQDFPQRLEPRLGLYGVGIGSDECASYLFLVDL
ncbi:TPR domain-containing glycosyltransferase [Paenibacillus radicis (ex Xue et al. 2023)]|uniref:Glycosyltransferase n=1 Tax=Paenibacillus radicis (ex Xue et al. 2023) TaxID=2972489 RepID=A0ABT1YPC4_9BACL|nr:TPR domain-containing glycosyltransferase [Paenibacillus radicis (ex Xue et al. 2023)]MCR8635028.1 glycosyltransferase [Paenibacillus radicis (ex Xue et al. 2023)]